MIAITKTGDIVERERIHLIARAVMIDATELKGSADGYPGSLDCEDVRARRRAMLGLPHVARLHSYVEELQAGRRTDIPSFDPLDGGMNARALFLFEAPDENAAASGFVSRDNHGSTASAVTANMRQADLPRETTCLWSVVPWGKHGQPQNLTDIVAGVECLKSLLLLLPCVEAIVLIGKRARRAQRHLSGIRPAVLISLHPSLLVQNRFPEKAADIPLAWAKVHEVIRAGRCISRRS